MSLGEATIRLADRETKVALFVVTPPYSRDLDDFKPVSPLEKLALSLAPFGNINMPPKTVA